MAGWEPARQGGATDRAEGGIATSVKPALLPADPPADSIEMHRGYILGAKALVGDEEECEQAFLVSCTTAGVPVGAGPYCIESPVGATVIEVNGKKKIVHSYSCNAILYVYAIRHDAVGNVAQAFNNEYGWTPFCCEDGTYTWTISYRGEPVYETSGVYWLGFTLKPTPEHKSIIVEKGSGFQLPITIKEAEEGVLSATATWSGGASASMSLEFTQ